MPRLLALIVALAVVPVSPSPAARADSPPAVDHAVTAQAGPSLRATVGLEGFVAPGRPTSVTAVVATPVLVTGRIRVRGGGVSVSRPVEVPAGGEQAFELGLPAMEADTRLVVELVDARGTEVARENINVRSPLTEMAVGVIGDDQVLATLGRVRSIVTDRPVAPLRVPASAPSSAFDVADYIVVAAGGADRLEDVLAWVRTGGRMIVDDGLSASLGVEGTPLETGIPGVTLLRLGAGEVAVVSGMATRSGDEWATILRPAPLDLANSPQFGFDGQGGLMQAASESGSRQVPSLPWLLFAILGFALLVGPVNFFVLSKLGKRDWAWVTIPMVAVLAVVGFWVAGRQRIAGTSLSHASVIVDDGSRQVRSAVVVAAGVAGERTVSFGEASSLFPERSVFGGGGAELVLADDTSVRVDLDQLGFVGVGVLGEANGVVFPRVETGPDGISVSNDSGLVFWGWGVVSGGHSTVSPRPLTAGEVGQVALPGGGANMAFGFIDSLMNQQRLWEDPQRANGLWPLSGVLASVTNDAGVYFVGLTDDYHPEVVVDGTRTQVEGFSLVVVRVAAGPDTTQATAAQVVDTGFINWLDWGSQRVVSTDEMTVGFRLADPVAPVRFRDSLMFGMPPERYEVWNWDGGAFEVIDSGDPLAGRHVSPDGQVFIRLIGTEFGDNPFSPDTLSLEPI